MTEGTDSKEWLEWIEVQKKATKTWLHEDQLAEAIALVDQYLSSNPARDLKREAIAFRGTLYEEQGDLSQAKEDFLAALALATEQDHVRFELEDSLAVISEKMGQVEESNRWYSTALKTAAAEPRVVGGGFLLRLLKSRESEGLDVEELSLAEQVVSHSWSLLRLSGEPNLEDLGSAIKRLKEAQGKPFGSTSKPSS